METKLNEDLKALICEGNTALLPTTPLQDYGGLKKVLIKAQGKYSRNTFIFPFPAEVVINRLLGGETIDWKKSTQFFATPEDMANVMADQIVGLEGTGIDFLEPQAGHGALIKAVLNIRPDINVTAIEKDDLNFAVLTDLYPNIDATQADFLTHDFGDKKFDLIVMNPPFTKNLDITHVVRAYSLLKYGGQLLSIMSNSWTFGSQKKQKDFRRFIEDTGALVRENGQGAFKTSGTMVQSVLVEINK